MLVTTAPSSAVIGGGLQTTAALGGARDTETTTDGALMENTGDSDVERGSTSRLPCKTTVFERKRRRVNDGRTELGLIAVAGEQNRLAARDRRHSLRSVAANRLDAMITRCLLCE